MNSVWSKIVLTGALFSSLSSAVSFAQTYKVAINPNSPPKAFQDEKGLPIGIDVDLIKAIAESQGFDVEFRLVDKKLQAIDEGQSDIAPSIVITDKRKEQYGVSVPYTTGYTTALYTKSDVLTDNAIENLSNAKVAVVFKTNKHTLLEKMNVPVIDAPTTFLGIKMVFKGDADLFVSDDSMLKYSIKQYPELGAKLMNLSVNGEIRKSEYGFVVSKGNPELLAKINAGLDEIKANGKYDAIFEQWLGE